MTNDASPSPLQQTRTAVYRSPLFAAHDNPSHPENQRRIAAIDRRLFSEPNQSDWPELPFGDAPLSILETVHNAWYVERLDRLATGGGAMLDHDTYITPQSYEAALKAAGAAVTAVDNSMSGFAPRGFALVRPPGHHATPEKGMGFCLFNNIAAAAVSALNQGLERVAIVDWDVHHGNGTQDVFYDDNRVLFCSVHQYPFYPGTGGRDECGSGKGEGYTINVPLLAGQGNAQYVQVFDQLFMPALTAFEPELILISAGYDAHVADPLGGMRLTEEGFAAMTARLTDLADSTAAGRIVAVLEGGYDPSALARSVESTLHALDGVIPGGV